jgi:hypothetical protein
MRTHLLQIAGRLLVPLSYPSKELVAADPDFWTPKPELGAKPDSATHKRRPRDPVAQ